MGVTYYVNVLTILLSVTLLTCSEGTLPLKGYMGIEELRKGYVVEKVTLTSER